MTSHGPCPRCGDRAAAMTDVIDVDEHWISREFTCPKCRLMFNESHPNLCPHDRFVSIGIGREQCDICGAYRQAKVI
jgi:transcription elongation factor Elf1